MTRWPAALFAVVLAIPAIASAQSLGPDELRFQTSNYPAAPILTIRTGVQLIEVPVIVRDNKRKGVDGLKASDFVLYDSGKKQQITSFTVETFQQSTVPAGAPERANESEAKPGNERPASGAPRYIALCLDDLNTDIESLVRAKKAARQFVQTSLAPGDQVAVATTALAGRIEFTADVAAMLARIDKVENHSRIGDRGLQCPSITPYEAYLISNRLDNGVIDAKITEARQCMSLPGDRAGQINMISSYAEPIWQTVLENDRATMRAIQSLVVGMAKLPGRRMVLLASSGFLSGNLENDQEDLIAQALKSEVVINTLGARGVYTSIPFGDGSESRSILSRSGGGRGRSQPSSADVAKAQSVDEQNDSRAQITKDDVMAVVATATGGTFFHDNNDLLSGLRELGMVPDVMYILGFSPTDMPEDGRFHGLKVQLAGGNRLTVQARKGYYAPTKSKALPEQPPPPTALDKQVNGNDLLTDLPISLSWTSDPQSRLVTCSARIDLSALKLAARDDRRVQALSLVATVRDASGNILAGQRRDIELNLKSETLARLTANGGLRFSVSLQAPAGAQVARAVIEDGLDGKMATSNRDLRFP